MNAIIVFCLSLLFNPLFFFQITTTFPKDPVFTFSSTLRFPIENRDALGETQVQI